MSKWEDSIKAIIPELKAFKSDGMTYAELHSRLVGNPLYESNSLFEDALDFASEIDPDPIDFDEYLSLLESMPTEEEYNAWMDSDSLSNLRCGPDQ